MVKLFTLADVTVTTAGTRVQATSSEVICTTIVLQAKTSNTGLVIVGDSDVAAGRGTELSPGQIKVLIADPSGRPGSDELRLDDIWFDTATNGNKVKVSYMKRR